MHQEDCPKIEESSWVEDFSFDASRFKWNTI